MSKRRFPFLLPRHNNKCRDEAASSDVNRLPRRDREIETPPPSFPQAVFVAFWANPSVGQKGKECNTQQQPFIPKCVTLCFQNAVFEVNVPTCLFSSMKGQVKYFSELGVNLLLSQRHFKYFIFCHHFLESKGEGGTQWEGWREGAGEMAVWHICHCPIPCLVFLTLGRSGEEH